MVDRCARGVCAHLSIHGRFQQPPQRARADFAGVRSPSLAHVPYSGDRGVRLDGDSTSMVYNLLSGDLTTRFVLKVTTTGIIAGTAFAHYQSDLRRDEKEMRT
jgi:hypothetical protein